MQKAYVFIWFNLYNNFLGGLTTSFTAWSFKVRFCYFILKMNHMFCILTQNFQGNCTWKNILNEVPESPNCTDSNCRTCVNVLTVVTVARCKERKHHIVLYSWSQLDNIVFITQGVTFKLFSQLSRSGGSMFRPPPAAGWRGPRAAQREASGSKTGCTSSSFWLFYVTDPECNCNQSAQWCLRRGHRGREGGFLRPLEEMKVYLCFLLSCYWKYKNVYNVSYRVV